VRNVVAETCVWDMKRSEDDADMVVVMKQPGILTTQATV
jgi:hypothetical protein